jgi:hypothetical protein
MREDAHARLEDPVERMPDEHKTFVLPSACSHPTPGAHPVEAYAAFFRRAARVLVAAFSDFDLACVWLPAGRLDG